MEPVSDVEELMEPVVAAVLMVTHPTRDEMRAMAEVGRQTQGRSVLVAT